MYSETPGWTIKKYPDANNKLNITCPATKFAKSRTAKLEELRYLFRQKKIDQFFDQGIFGSPRSKHEIIKQETGANDPGVRSVRRIYEHYKRHGIATEVMGASFRNAGQIVALAGCDLLTISPELLGQLAASEAPLERALDAEAARAMELAEVRYDEAAFRFALNEDAMGTEKLAEGIRAFCADALRLEQLIQPG